MSDLAFNVNGERFSLPAEAELWRVRRFKPSGRGTPEVVFDADGLPLTISVDADIASFRQAVDGQPGRYRLDPVDAGLGAVEAGQAAYLQIREARARTPAGGAQGAGGQEELIRELVRVNSEMVKQITDKFAMVMESAATLLKAADGAGLPAREPIAPAPPPVIEEEDEDEDETRNAAGSELSQLIEGVLPLVQMVVSQKLAKPRNAAPVESVADEHELDPEEPDADELAAALDDEAREMRGTRGDDDAEPEAPALTPQAMAHFAAIQQRLSPEEAVLAQAVAQELSPQEINVRIAELTKLSVDDAAALVRRTIAGSKGGAS